MKKILTVAVCKNADSELTAPCEEIDIFYPGKDGRQGDKSVYGLLRQAKSKYTVLVDSDFTFKETDSFLKELDVATADIIVFDGGYLFKSAILKGLPARLCVDRYSAEIFGAFNAKTVSTVNLKPFAFNACYTEYSDEIAARLSDALDEFKKSKSKLPKEVYSFIFKALLSRLITFYMSAMLAVREKSLAAEALKEFDTKLRDNIVLYLALDKRFSAADLKKLRGKDFKINFLECNKFKKSIKK